MLESKIRCHWNSDTQGDTTTRPGLTCVSTMSVVMRQVWNLVGWSGLSAEPDSPPCLGLWDVAQGVKSLTPTSCIMSLSPCPHAAALPCYSLTPRQDLPKSWVEHSWAWPMAVWDLLQFLLCHPPDWLWYPHCTGPLSSPRSWVNLLSEPTWQSLGAGLQDFCHPLVPSALTLFQVIVPARVDCP